MTDRHPGIRSSRLKNIFDNLNIPDAERTLRALLVRTSQMHDRPEIRARKQAGAWAIETATNIFNTIGRNDGDRVVAPEMDFNDRSGQDLDY